MVACETEDNDSMVLEEWWAKLKAHRHLGREGEDDTARASQDSAGLEVQSGAMASPAHDPAQVEAWETERQLLAREREHDQDLQEKELAQREEEERRQEEEDVKLLEAHEGQQYKDWENWVVLHSPSQPKRRRLVVTTQGRDKTDAPPPMATTRAELWVPRKPENMLVTLQLDTTSDLPSSSGAMESAPVGSGVGVDWNGRLYQNAYEEWKRGELSSAAVTRIFGDDWLMLFEVTKDGVGGEDTLPTGGAEQGQLGEATSSGPVGEGMVQSTQLDEGGSGSASGGWGLALRDAGDAMVKDLDESQDGQQG